MTTAIIALLIGLLLAGAGVYYLARGGRDAESKKVYAITTAVGAAVAAVAAIMLLG